MLTIEELTTGADPVLELVASTSLSTQNASVRTVDAVMICPDWRPPGATQCRDGLAIIPANAAEPADPAGAIRGLLRRGIVAVVLAISRAGARPPLSPELATAAERAGVPLLTPLEPGDAHQTRERIRDRQIAVERHHAEFLGRLLAEQGRAYRRGEGPELLLKILSEETGSQVHLTAPGLQHWDELREYSEIERVRTGTTASAAIETQGRHVLIYPVGAQAPHTLLVASRPTLWPRHLTAAVAEVAAQATLLQHPLAHLRERAAREESDRTIRQAIFHRLMAGDWADAAALGQRVMPGVLSTTETVSVAVLTAAPDALDDRRALATAIEWQIPRSVVILCPGEHRHVIAVIPEDENTPDLMAALAPVVHQRPGRAGGISAPEPITRTADAYEDARHALIAAEDDHERLVHSTGWNPLISHLSPQAAVWAEHVRRGLQTQLTPTQRKIAVPTTKMALTYGAGRATRYYGVNMSGVSRRGKMVMQAMGFEDPGDVHARAAAQLALALPDPEDQLEARPQRCPPLHMLLTEPAVTDFAHTTLAVLDDPAIAPAGGWLTNRDDREPDPGQDARELLRLWLENGCDQKAAAAALGMSRNSLPRRLVALEPRLRLKLRYPGAGQHTLLWLLVATGLIPSSRVPDPTSRVATE